MDIKQIREQTHKEMRIPIFISQFVISSFKRALIYTLIAIMLSLLFYFLAGNIIKISSNNFVAIMSSTSAASGALLAVSIAFYTFLGRYMADWRDRLYERFIKERDELKSQIQISAKHHPEISRRLVDL
ncbi:MAG: hypothetical protein WBC75_10355, partial [Dehalococcoidales bacterium]